MDTVRNDTPTPAAGQRPARYRKKPIVIEAIQWTGDNPDEILDWSGLHAGQLWVAIETLEGTMKADIGDWIIKGVQGEFYPCKPDIFEATCKPITGGEV